MTLRLSKLHVHYGSSHVLHDVDLEIGPGEVACLLGRNGAGKSTTVSSIAGFVTPTSGTISFEGKDITAMSIEARARAGIALVPQGRRVFALLTVEENLLVGARQRARAGSAAASQGQPWTLERVYTVFPRLKERRSNLGSQLSGGEQQMLAIGRALMANPSLILMDEPSEGLAPLVIEDMYRIIKQVAGHGMSILLVEHSLEEAIEMANRLYIMNKGDIVFQTRNPDDLTDEVRQRFLGVAEAA